MKKHIVFCLMAVLMLSGCAGPVKIMGANYLQTHKAALDSRESYASLSRLHDIGANTVAFVPFLKQDGIDSVDVHLTDNVTDEQLRAGIRDAKTLGFRVVVKPQILVQGSWAGNIKMKDDPAWGQWFDNYTRAIEHYADIAREENVDILIVGTELNQTFDLPFWKILIPHIRQHFTGHITYAAHNADGVRQFKYWNLLDSITLTLYPSLGNIPERNSMTQYILKVVKELSGIRRQYGKSLWIAEVGIPSRHGAQLKPWEYHEEKIEDNAPDEELQAVVLDIWLDALKGRWNNGVMLWYWSSNPSDGGTEDNGFTMQNKLAERVITCHWSRKCGQQ